MKKTLFTFIAMFGFAGVAFALPYYSQQASLIPIDSTENIGTTTSPWAEGHFTQICLSADCKTAWPAGGSGVWPFTTTDTNYGVAVQSTTTPEWFKNGMMASSTSYFNVLNTSATSTVNGLNIGNTYGVQFQGYASVPQLFAGDPGTGVHFDGPGIISWHSSGTQRMLLNGSGNLGIATSAPGTLLSLGNTGVDTINISATATSTFGSGLNIRSGCFSINGTCIGMGAGSGTVTSVDMTVPTGLSISGNPVTTSGTLALALAAGYNIPLTASTTNWNTFYDTPSNRITAGTNLSWSGNTLNSAFSFTPQTWGNSTSTTLGFLNGFISTASSTITAPLHLSNTLLSSSTALFDVDVTSPQFKALSSIEMHNNASLDFFSDAGITNIGGLFYNSPNNFSIAGTVANATIDTSQLTLGTTAAFPNNITGTLGIGVSTTTSRLAYWGSNGGLYSVATTSASCSGNTTCTAFTVLGSSPITISSTGGGSGLSTTSPISDSNVLVYSSTGAGAAYGAATSTLTVSGPFTYPSISVIGASGAITYTGLATTSQPSSSNLLTSNGGSGVYGTATSTLTATGPLTGSFTQIGTGGSLGCQTASGAQAGCLASADWTTFNNKQATMSATWPITLSGATIGFNGLATSTAAVVGNIPYFSGVNTFANVATTTPTLGLGLSGALTTLNNVAQSLSIATSSLYSGTTGQFPYFSGTNTITATSTLFISTDGKIGIGTVSPTSNLDVTANTNLSFNVTGASESQSRVTFTAQGSQTYHSSVFVGQRSRGTFASKSVVTSGDDLFVVGGAGWDGSSYNQSADIKMIAEGTYSGTNKPAYISFNTTPANDTQFGNTQERMRITSAGLIGIGTSTPYSKLSVWGSGTGTGQLFGLTNNASTTVMQVLDNGNTTLLNVSATNATTTGTMAIPVGASVITPIAGNMAIDSTTGQLRYSDTTGAVKVIPGFQTMAFSYATSSQGTGTTTKYMAPAAANLTVQTVRCDFSNFMDISLYDGTNRANLVKASSTIGTFSYTTNNTFTSGEAIRVDIGTTTASLGAINGGCRFKYTYDAD